MLSIYGYTTASTDIAAYILGGNDDCDKKVSTIAEYRNDKWTKYGDLRSKRYRASTLFLNGEHIIFGGERITVSDGVHTSYFRPQTEVWNFKTNTSRIINTFKAMRFDGSHGYTSYDINSFYFRNSSFDFSNPIIFPVESNFCDN